MSAAEQPTAEYPVADHPMAELAPAYAVGALDADERTAFEAHLAGCPACAADVRADGDVSAALAHAAADGAAPPSALRARSVAEARAGVTVEAPAVATAEAATESRRPRLTVDDGGLRAGIPAAAPATRGSGWGVRTPWLAAAASLVLAAGLGAAWGRERGARLRAETALAGLGRADQARAELAARLAERDSLVAALTEPDVRTARLAATGAQPAMRLTWSRRRGVVLVTASALAAPAPGRIYQLWGIRGREAPQSLGLLAPDAGGRLQAVLRVPPGAAMDVVAVTDEPAGGSARATTAPLMVGTLGAE